MNKLLDFWVSHDLYYGRPFIVNSWGFILRMWMVDTKILCKKHLLGEHGEIHKHRHNFVKTHRIDGRIFPQVQIEPMSMKSRHDELAKEMLCRGMNHNSPYEMPDLSYLPDTHRFAKVDVKLSLNDLLNRCPECVKRKTEERYE